MESINLFENINMLEPKCPGCETVIKLGLTTKYIIRKKAHICLKCGCVLK